MEASFALLITFFTIYAALISGIEPTRFILQNDCPYTIWPAILTSPNSPTISNTGLTLIQGLSSTIESPSGWSGKFWARTLCSTNSLGRFACSVGDCGTGNVSCSGNYGNRPYSVVEFSLNGFSNQDFYDVSLIDGFNIPVMVTPSNGACSDAGCPNDINSICPWSKAVKDPRNTSSVVACNSGCSSSAGGCSDPSDFTVVFKSVCPQTFTYSTDPTTNTFTCASGGDYFITFCPNSAPAQPQFIGAHGLSSCFDLIGCCRRGCMNCCRRSFLLLWQKGVPNEDDVRLTSS